MRLMIPFPKGLIVYPYKINLSVSEQALIRLFSPAYSSGYFSFCYQGRCRDGHSHSWSGQSAAEMMMHTH